MKLKKMIPFILIVTCIYFLIFYENQFQYKQKLLILESNNLFTSQHVFADSSVNSVWKKHKNSHDNFRVFGLLERSTKQTIMAFYTTDYSKFLPPMKSGSFFLSPDSKEAIVGESVNTSIENGIEYFIYRGVKYKVIGELGISDNSPLKKYVLINDSSLIEKYNKQLIFDGKETQKITWLKGKVMESKGIERWFNINFLLRWIKMTTMIVIICSSVLAAYFFTVATKEIRCIRFQIGIGIKKILKIDLLIITFFSFIMALIIWFLSIVKNVHMYAEESLIYYILFYIILVMTNIILSIHQITKEAENVE